MEVIEFRSQFKIEFAMQDLELRRGSVSAPPSPTGSTNARIEQSNEVRLRRRSLSDAELVKRPVPAPGSPACRALKQASIKVEAKLIDKRLRIGKKKIGRIKYKKSGNRPKGNEIHAQHEQYALTYGMMSGILNSVGLQNQFKKRLTMNDFMRVDKTNFHANGKLQRPFKFKDYSPDIFRQIRRRFDIDSADYMLTLCGDFNYIEFISNSKSGQFFFYSHDGRFMIKTQTKAESKFLRRILPHYYKFIMENPNTLITRFYGMHRVKMHHLRRKMHFVIMASVFDTPKEIHTRYDLKGSIIGRQATPHEVATNGVLKDMDMMHGTTKVAVGVSQRAMLLEQIRKDVEFLKQMKIMDYSMLVGVHDPSKVGALEPPVKQELRQKRGPLPDIQYESLTDVENSPKLVSRRSLSFHGLEESKDETNTNVSEALSTVVVDDEDDSTDEDILPTPDALSPRFLELEKLPSWKNVDFCTQDGGIIGQNRHGDSDGCLYFLGIIDILQQYNSRKIAETFFKGFRHNRKQISAVNPNFYGDRFIAFMENNVFVDE